MAGGGEKERRGASNMIVHCAARLARQQRQAAPRARCGALTLEINVNLLCGGSRLLEHLVKHRAVDAHAGRGVPHACRVGEEGREGTG